MCPIALGADRVIGKRGQLSRQGFENHKEAERALEEHLNEMMTIETRMVVSMPKTNRSRRAAYLDPDAVACI